MEWRVATAEKMEDLGARCAYSCAPPLVVYLRGELGAGKTTFVRGYLRALGWQKTVKSPTYTLVEPYSLADRIVYHFDLYRLTDPNELEYIGIRDCHAVDAVLLIEWPERGRGVLPLPDWDMTIEYSGTARRVVLTAHSARGGEALLCIQSVVTPGPAEMADKKTVVP